MWLLAGVLALNAVALGAFAAAVAIEGRRRNLQLRRLHALRRIDGDRPRGERVVVPFARPHAAARDGRRRSSAGRAVAILVAGAILCGGTALAATPTRHTVASAFVALAHGFTSEPRVVAEAGSAPARSPSPPAAPAITPAPAPSFRTPSADMGTEPHYVALPPTPALTSAPETQAPEIPAAPEVVGAVAASSSTIDVSWTAVEGAVTYRVERSTDGVGGWAKLTGPQADPTTFVDEGLDANVTYYYRVISIGADRASVPSDVVSATTLPAPPPATAVTPTPSSSSQIVLVWTDVEGETGYRIERSTDGVGWTEIGTTGADVTTYIDGGLAPSTTYSYRVFATNLGGDSPPSEVVSATTLDAVTDTPAASVDASSSAGSG